MVNGRGNPDIILTNRHGLLNYTYRRGDITISDHLPLHLTLSYKPIRISATSTFNTKRADWDRYKRHIQDEYVNTDFNNLPDRLTKHDVDNRLQNWFHNLVSARAITVPKTSIKYTPFPFI